MRAMLCAMAYDQSAVITVHLAAPPERVYAALTDAAALQAWYWPDSMAPQAFSDPVVGGRFGIEAAGAGFAGHYTELDPPRRIVQSWRWQGDHRDSRVAIDLAAADGGTDLTVVHDQVDEATAELYRQGWASCLDRLLAYV
jgi:uncharacterized protein YndB with AHSA1/START domain